MFKFWRTRKKPDKENKVLEQQSSKAINIRDFLYLDVERTKSIFAQLEEGLVTGRERVGGTAKEVTGKGGGGVPALLSLAAEGKFIWENEERETKTLHDYMYNYVESKMLDSKSIITINSASVSLDGPTRGKLNSQINQDSFLLISGKITLDDYDYLKGILENFNELSKFIARCSTIQTTEKLSKPQRKQLERELLESKPFADWFVNGLKKFFDTFYKERCMITIRPNESIPEVYFTGHLIKTFIRDGLESVIFRYGTSPKIQWCVFAQVAYIPHQSESGQHDASFQDDVQSQITPSIDEAFRNTFSAFRDIEKLAIAVPHPAIAIIPIAIYR
jgi:hypothetical protein